MDYSEKIRSAWIRSSKGLAKRPHLGKITRSVTARLTDGLTCEIVTGDHRMIADSPEIAGGNDKGMAPTLILETALASCLAIGYRQCLAAREIPVSDIQVEVTASYDVCSAYGLDNAHYQYHGNR